MPIFPHARARPRTAKRPLWLVARSVCLEAGNALTVDELTRGVFRAGYESSSAQFKYYLLRILRQSEDFVCTSGGRWTVRPGGEVATAYWRGLYSKIAGTKDESEKALTDVAELIKPIAELF